MLSIERGALAGVCGGGDAPVPGPNRTETTGTLTIDTPLFSTTYDPGTTRSSKTDYAKCVDSQGKTASASDVVAACGLPKRGG